MTTLNRILAVGICRTVALGEAAAIVGPGVEVTRLCQEHGAAARAFAGSL